jgi:hypothetical protein
MRADAAAARVVCSLVIVASVEQVPQNRSRIEPNVSADFLFATSTLTLLLSLTLPRKPCRVTLDLHTRKQIGSSGWSTHIFRT